MTWGELAARTDRVCAAVQAHLEAAARPVAAVVGSMGVETVVSVLALLEDRVPFVLLHPRWRRAERDRALLMSGASMVIGEDGGLTMLPAGAASGISPNRGTGDERQSRPGSRRPGAPSEPPPDAGAVDERRPRPTPRRTGAPSGNPLGGGAVVVFTSGSTGRPRGAVLSHAALCASAQAHARVFGWQRGDRWLLSLPTAHVGGLMIVVRSLLARRTIVLGGREPDGSFDAGAALRTIDRRAVTLWSVVPTMLGRLLDRVEGAPPASLRAVLVGGAPAPPALMARARRRRWPVFATYGLTEACSQVAVERPPSGLGGAGEPLPGVQVRIAVEPIEDLEHGGGRDHVARGRIEPADGRPGSIRIRGPMLFSGYLGPEPDAPLDRPFDADGWFDTGDLGALDASGRLHVAGRRSDRILTGGENVDPAEVEAAVVEWPGAAAACVVGVDDEVWGERVAAVVAGSAVFEAAGGLAALEERLRTRLAGFKLPRLWKVVERLPLAASGKVDRRACRALLVESGNARTVRQADRRSPPTRSLSGECAVHRKPAPEARVQ